MLMGHNYIYQKTNHQTIVDQMTNYRTGVEPCNKLQTLVDQTTNYRTIDDQVCVRACVHACVRVCVCVRECVRASVCTCLCVVREQ